MTDPWDIDDGPEENVAHHRHPTLYSLDSRGSVRLWWMERDGLSRYRTCSGLEGGGITASMWTEARPTNAGRANARTGEQQAVFEVNAKYKSQLKGSYWRTRDGALLGESRFFEPMLAEKFKGIAQLVKWGYDVAYLQPKSDGFRCVARADGLWSRTGERISSCPHVEDGLAQFFKEFPDAVLDGELYNHAYHAEFEKLSSMLRKGGTENHARTAAVIQYHVYDCLAHADDDAPFASRSKRLEAWFSAWLVGPTLSDASQPVVELVPTLRFALSSAFILDERYERWLLVGYEGMMVRLDEPYKRGPGRSRNLLKHKPSEDAEFPVTGLLQGEGNWASCARMAECTAENGEKFYPDITGDRDYCKALWLAFAQGRCPRVATVRFWGRTAKGIPRFPKVKGFDRSDA